jgi:hypothetical protein
MSEIQVEHTNYEMPPKDGISITYFIPVAAPKC